MGGNIPGWNFLDGNYPGGIHQGGIWKMGVFRVGVFGWEFSWCLFRFLYKRFIKFAFRLLRRFVFLSVFILKTLAFHYKYKVIFGCSVSRSLLYSVSFYIYIYIHIHLFRPAQDSSVWLGLYLYIFIYLLLKSRLHFFFGSNLNKSLWESNYLEVLCRIKVIPKWAISLKKLRKRV